VQEIEELCKELEPVIGKKKAKGAYLAYKMFPKEGEAIRAQLLALKSKHLHETYAKNHPYLPPPDKGTSQGDIVLGDVYYGPMNLYPFGLRKDELIKHCGILGITGSGKTNAGFVMLEELKRLRVPVMVFDWQKNFRNIISTRWGRDFRIFTVGRNIRPFFINPLIPPIGVEYDRWIDANLDILSDAFYVGHGVVSVYKELIYQTFSERGIPVTEKYDGRQQDIPSMLEIGHRIMEFQPKRGEVKADWKASSTRVVKGLSSGVAANIFSISGRVPVERLFSTNVIFELKALSGDTKKFFINWFLNYLLEYWDAQESHKEQLNHVVMIDEAHHILMKRTLEGTEPVTDSMFREVRKHGVGLVYLDQSPSRISETVLGNTNTTFVMNLKSMDIPVAVKAVSMEYQKWPYITWLKEGFAIARLQFRHPHPFLVRFKLMEIDKASIKDDDLKGMQKGITAKDEGSDLKEAFEEGIKEISSSGEKKKEEELEGPEALLLINIASKPFLGALERYEDIGLGRGRGPACLELLTEKGLVASRWYWDGKVPRKKLLELTAEGRQALKRLGWEGKARKANESIEHAYIKSHIADYLRKRGWKATIEKRIGSHYPDVHAERQGHSLVIEVERGESEFWDNILKNLEAGHDIIVSLPLRRALKEKIQRKVEALPGPEQERVRVFEQRELYGWLAKFLR
jgi:DNA-binding PadR family transcriptional regulator